MGPRPATWRRSSSAWTASGRTRPVPTRSRAGPQAPPAGGTRRPLRCGCGWPASLRRSSTGCSHEIRLTKALVSRREVLWTVNVGSNTVAERPASPPHDGRLCGSNGSIRDAAPSGSATTNQSSVDAPLPRGPASAGPTSCGSDTCRGMSGTSGIGEAAPTARGEGFQEGAHLPGEKEPLDCSEQGRPTACAHGEEASSPPSEASSPAPAGVELPLYEIGHARAGIRGTASTFHSSPIGRPVSTACARSLRRSGSGTASRRWQPLPWAVGTPLATH